ncbi:hypothetical protein HPB50_025597 [Hyalomma asiaticum]|uniref:Uncharacterized protein n=1 Tax=Hyalomma asiaticum TaxID=266040 RepID=A0ACB7TR47_HYAAI|nr:hypothetical protein HPB50_025597 [Hyalomma asiaticum]
MSLSVGAGSAADVLFALLLVFPALLRLKLRSDDELLGDFPLFPRLPVRLEDVRLCARCRLPPCLERAVVADEELRDRWRRRLLLRFFLSRLLTDSVVALPLLVLLRLRPLRGVWDERMLLPRLLFLSTRRCFGAALAAECAVLDGECAFIEPFLRLLLCLSGAAASVLDPLCLVASGASAALRNFPAGDVAVASGAARCTESSLRGLPRGRLGGEESFEGPALFSSVVGCLVTCVVLGGLGFSSAAFLGMVFGVCASLDRVLVVSRVQPAALLRVTAVRQARAKRIRWSGTRSEQPARLHSRCWELEHCSCRCVTCRVMMTIMMVYLHEMACRPLVQCCAARKPGGCTAPRCLQSSLPSSSQRYRKLPSKERRSPYARGAIFGAFLRELRLDVGAPAFQSSAAWAPSTMGGLRAVSNCRLPRAYRGSPASVRRLVIDASRPSANDASLSECVITSRPLSANDSPRTRMQPHGAFER